MNKSTKDFCKGYACAVATMVKIHGVSTVTEEVYGCCFCSVNKLVEMGADEGDIEALYPLILEIERKRKQ